MKNILLTVILLLLPVAAFAEPAPAIPGASYATAKDKKGKPLAADSQTPAEPQEPVSNLDYEAIYRNTPVPSHSYIHNIDPGEPYDVQRAIWSPYSLFRLSSPIFFKTIKIEPGYYLLTPREFEAKWYILFKDAGQIKYIVPAYDRQVVPENFYYENLPQRKLRFTEKFAFWGLDTIGKLSKDSRRKPIQQTFLETTDLDNHFVLLIIYWGNYKYYAIFRTVPL